MRNNQPVTNNERVVSEEEKIVSTTNLGGKILYVNQYFLDIAGFSMDEVIDQPHNMIRHPDMPSIAFKELWSTVKEGKPWMGIVKNRCKNGDYYWVDAFVTPIMENNQVVGYQSVRRKPDQAVVERAKRLYGISPDGFSKYFRGLSSLPLWVKSYLLTSLLLGVSLLATELLGSWLYGLAAYILLGAPLLRYLLLPITRLSKEASDLCASSIAQTVYGASTNEAGKIKTALHFKDSLRDTVLWRVKEATDLVDQSCDEVSQATSVTLKQIHQLNLELDQVATAMHEMVATVSEMASNSSVTAGAVTDSEGMIVSGKKLLIKAGDSINDVKEKMDANMDNINQLASSSEDIGKIIEVIKKIADQTNLLALNAAIEAARAGEQGRGFSVVADEVRHLAKETQNSTENIQKMIEKLQRISHDSVKAILDCQNSTKLSAESSQEANTNMDSIQDSISKISDMSLQIAAATEEQSTVSEEINRNIHNIKNAAQIGQSSIDQVKVELDGLVTASGNLSQMLTQFKTV